MSAESVRPVSSAGPGRTVQEYIDETPMWADSTAVPYSPMTGIHFPRRFPKHLSGHGFAFDVLKRAREIKRKSLTATDTLSHVVTPHTHYGCGHDADTGSQ
jgi:hypothetical protein